MDGVFEGGDIKTGFYAEPNRGDEFRTGVKRITSGQSYRVAHRFGRLHPFDGRFWGFSRKINPRLEHLTFSNGGIEIGGKAFPLTTVLESEYR